MSTKIALLQLNPVVGDITGNADLISKFSKIAEQSGASFAVT